ncbi:MAG: polysaccharide deacetylase family protein [Candidatus Latescibacteria bacterium]|jgi:peptidoglycan-N-acetylglucosamine deacetylase|nr:polysaccharide deacetylase family protein [Candidatus Latescibacterota bacterium]
MKANISIDFEGEEQYFRTLGVSPEGRLSDNFYSRCAERFLEIFERVGVKATFFIVGQDVDENLDTLRQIVKAGHQIGNHSHDHQFAMSRYDVEEQNDDIQRAHEKIKSALDVEARCYRAPCYDVSYPNIEFLHSLGYQCDSSFYPSNLAYFQRLFLKAYTNRPVSMGPTDVHRYPGRPFLLDVSASPPVVSDRANGTTLLEVPIPYFSPLQLPLYSTPQFALGKGFVVRGVRSLLRRQIPFTYELHSLDVACETTDGIDPALRRIPQMRVGLQKKTSDFEEIFTIMKNEADIVPITDLA